VISAATRWALGNLPELRQDPLAFLEQITREQGDVARFRVGPVSVVVINQPELTMDVLSMRATEFPKGRARPASRILFGEGLLNSDGKRWREQRDLTSAALRDSLPAANESIGKLVSELLEEWSENEVRDVYQDFQRLSLRLVCQVLFGRDADALHHRMSAALDELTRQFITMPMSSLVFPMCVPTPANMRARRAAKQIHHEITDLATTHSPDCSPSGVWLRTVRSDPSSRRDWIHQATALLMAGHETTALALTWTLWLLATHPREQERVRTALSSEKQDLRVLECIIQESLRLFPPVYAIGREAKNTVAVGGSKISRGTSVFVSQWLSHRDRRWFADPLAFRPDRWQETSVNSAAYYPFGIGPRTCVGRQLAQQTLRAVLSSLLMKFAVTPESKDIRLRASLTVQPAQPVLLRLSRL
jgi:cytochrome P450